MVGDFKVQMPLPELMSCNPLSWFFGNPSRLRRDQHRELVHWRPLVTYGWSETQLCAAEYGDLPAAPGVYVIACEIEDVALYVGESINLAQRLRTGLHSKVRELIRLYESAYAGYHNQAEPEGTMRLLYKEVQHSWPALSSKQALIWHEAVAIALLCPIAQHSTAKLHEMNIQLGTGFFSRGT
jgi:hypothetical protein